MLLLLPSLLPPRAHVRACTLAWMHARTLNTQSMHHRWVHQQHSPSALRWRTHGRGPESRDCWREAGSTPSPTPAAALPTCGMCGIESCLQLSTAYQALMKNEMRRCAHHWEPQSCRRCALGSHLPCPATPPGCNSSSVKRHLGLFGIEHRVQPVCRRCRGGPLASPPLNPPSPQVPRTPSLQVCSPPLQVLDLLGQALPLHLQRLRGGWRWCVELQHPSPPVPLPRLCRQACAEAVNCPIPLAAPHCACHDAEQAQGCGEGAPPHSPPHHRAAERGSCMQTHASSITADSPAAAPAGQTRPPRRCAVQAHASQNRQHCQQQQDSGGSRPQHALRASPPPAPFPPQRHACRATLAGAAPTILPHPSTHLEARHLLGRHLLQRRHRRLHCLDGEGYRLIHLHLGTTAERGARWQRVGTSHPCARRPGAAATTTTTCTAQATPHQHGHSSMF